MHSIGSALTPKGYDFNQYAHMGSSIARLGSGIVHGKSPVNAAVGHQDDSSVYKTSGISTTPLIERVFYYA